MNWIFPRPETGWNSVAALQIMILHWKCFAAKNSPSKCDEKCPATIIQDSQPQSVRCGFSYIVDWHGVALLCLWYFDYRSTHSHRFSKGLRGAWNWSDQKLWCLDEILNYIEIEGFMIIRIILFMVASPGKLHLCIAATAAVIADVVAREFMKTMRTWFWRKPSKFFIFIDIFILSRHLHVILLRILLFSIVPIVFHVVQRRILTGTTTVAPSPVKALVK